MHKAVKFEKIIEVLLIVLLFSIPLSIDSHLYGDSLGITLISEPLMFNLVFFYFLFLFVSNQKH